MRPNIASLAAVLTALFTLAGPMATMAATAPDSCAATQSTSLSPSLRSGDGERNHHAVLTPKSNCCAGDCCLANAPQPPTPGALATIVGQPAPVSSAVHFAAVNDFTATWLGSAPIMLFARSPGRTLSLLQTYLL